eukprot:scaffold94671_cov40-Prasinocladus_malaysianus.AAC.3
MWLTDSATGAAGQVWRISEVYSLYFYSPTCAAHPPPPGPQRWFFVNVILADNKANVVLPSGIARQGSGSRAGGPSRSGLALAVPLCRVGYSWGGDREAALHVNLDSGDATAVQANGMGADDTRSQLLRPFYGKFETVWHNPSQAQVSTTVMQLSTTPLEVRLAFSSVPLLRQAVNLISSQVRSPASDDVGEEREEDPPGEAGQGATEASSSNSGAAAPTGPRRASVTSASDQLVTLEQRKLYRAVVQCTLVDTRHGLNIEVLEVSHANFNKRLGRASVHNLAARLGSEELTPLADGSASEDKLPPPVSEVVANVSMQTEVCFLNSAVDVMEPLVEMWPVTCELRHGRGASSVFVRSEERFNACLAPSSFRSIGDALAFLDEVQMAGPAEPWAPLQTHSPIRMFRRSVSIDLARRDQ